MFSLVLLIKKEAIDAGLPKTGKRVGNQLKIILMYKRFYLMIILLVALMNFGFSDSNTKNRKKDYSTSQLFREKHIDITVTSSNGCTFHVAGTVNYTILPPRLNGFVGTLTIGGPSYCPHQTFNINYTAFNESNVSKPNETKWDDEVDLIFNTDEICDLSTATWIAPDQSSSDAINNSGISEKLIEEIKEGECN